MRIAKIARKITLGPSDAGYQILIKGKKGELLNLKVGFTDKGFGIQAFKERAQDPHLSDLIIFIADKAFADDYVAVWKLYQKPKETRVKRFRKRKRKRRK